MEKLYLNKSCEHNIWLWVDSCAWGQVAGSFEKRSQCVPVASHYLTNRLFTKSRKLYQIVAKDNFSPLMKSKFSRNCLRFRDKRHVEPNKKTSTAQSSKFQRVIVIAFNFPSQILNIRRLTFGAAENSSI